MKSEFIFLCHNARRASVGTTEKDKKYVLWKFSPLSPCPPGMNFVLSIPLMALMLFYYLVGRKENFACVAVQENNMIIHRTFITSKWFRFPFLGEGDIQVGIWTHKNYRRRGVAYQVLKYVMEEFGGVEKIWYIVNKENTASFHLAQKCGFMQIGEGEKIARAGLRIFGYYKVTKQTDAVPIVAI